MSRPIHRHPRFEELCDLFQAHPEWFCAWHGTLFRLQTLDFPSPKDVLSGEGARWRGGRWNPPGLATLYGSTTDNTALEECKANDRYYGVETKGPRLLIAIETRLTRLLKLNAPTVRRGMHLMPNELESEDWRKLLAAGKESFTQAIGRAVSFSGGSGLLARSAAVARGVNVVVFPGVCTKDRLEVVHGKKLEKLGLRTRG
jgi:RES domain-containing protein